MKFKLIKFSTIFFTALLVCLLGYFLQPKIYKGEAIFTVQNSSIVSDSQHINLYVLSPTNIYKYADFLKLEKNKKNFSNLANAIAMQKIDNSYTRISISASSEKEVTEIYSAVIFGIKSLSEENQKIEIRFLNSFFIDEVKFLKLFTALFFALILSLIVYFCLEFYKND
jgi:hypothetical protein